MKIVEKIFDVSTGEETIIERDETPQEEQERELFEQESKSKAEASAAVRANKAALLEKLGITEEEARLLLA
jgi:hypothetical protein